MLDTNIIVGVWLNAAAANARLRSLLRLGNLSISPIVHTELFAHPGISERDIDEFLSDLRISIHPLADEVWRVAGRRFAAYAARRRDQHSEGPRRLVADFVIGAHALQTGRALATLDTPFYERNFAELKLL